MGHNLTTKVTLDKLTKLWKAAGSPTDSNAVAGIIKQAGVSDEVLSAVFKASNLESPTTAAAAPAAAPAATSAQPAQPQAATSKMTFKDVQAQVSQLSRKDAAKLLAFVDQLPPATPAKKAPAAQAQPTAQAQPAAQPQADLNVPAYRRRGQAEPKIEPVKTNSRGQRIDARGRFTPKPVNLR